MKQLYKLALPLVILTGSLQAGDNSQCLELANDEMNAPYRTGCGCEDGVFNAVSNSMLGWGVGLFVGIALLTGLVHNAHQGSQTTTSSSSSSSSSTNSTQ